eukprot:365481-Chlamydomonas_euryale.AAC.6
MTGQLPGGGVTAPSRLSCWCSAYGGTLTPPTALPLRPTASCLAPPPLPLPPPWPLPLLPPPLPLARLPPIVSGPLRSGAASAPPSACVRWLPTAGRLAASAARADSAEVSQQGSSTNLGS